MSATVMVLWGVLVLAGCGDKDTGDDAPVDGDADGHAADVDCDDANPDLHPDAAEVCDNVDNDCDDLVDDADDDVEGAPTWWMDSDGDGYGDPAAPLSACLMPDGAVDDDQDCDDGNAAILPGADERCDGLDNDCDGLADDEDLQGAVDEAVYYWDVDGDGYGDPSSSVLACLLPEGASADGTDCDDTNPWVNPGHPEVCDGVDNDCSPATGESGLASWAGGDGTIGDVTASLTGTAEEPAALTLTEAGTLRLCAGTWYAGLTVLADAEILGVPSDPASVVLDGAGTRSVVWIEGDGLEVGIEGLAITGGLGSAGPFGSSEGGGLLCQSSGAPVALRLSTVDIVGNTAAYGGGIFAQRCDTTFAQVWMDENRAEEIGGGGWFIDGTHTWADSAVTENTAADSVGGVAFIKDSAEVVVTFDEVEVSGNQAVSGTVGAVAVVGGSLDWTGTTKTGSGAFGNRAEDWPGGLHLSEATFVGEVVDFGESDSDGDNGSIDVTIEELGASYNAPDNASFDCGADGCGEPVSFDLSSAGTTWSARDGQLVAVVVRSDSRDTIERLQVHGYADAGCTATPVVLKADRSSLDTASWDALWTGEEVTWASSADWHDLGYPRRAVEENDGIAAGYICNCPTSDDRCYGSRSSSVPVLTTDAGFGTAYGVLSETDFEIGGTAYYFTIFGPFIYTRFDVVEL